MEVTPIWILQGDKSAPDIAGKNPIIQAAIKDLSQSASWAAGGCVLCSAHEFSTASGLRIALALFSRSKSEERSHSRYASRPPARRLPSFIILVKGLAIIIHIIRLKPRAPAHQPSFIYFIIAKPFFRTLRERARIKSQHLLTFLISLFCICFGTKGLRQSEQPEMRIDERKRKGEKPEPL